MGGVKYGHIGLGVGTMVLIIGSLLFQGSDDALQVVAIVGFITTFAVYHGLDERDKRRKRRGQ